MVLTITFTATNVAASDALLFRQVDPEQNTYKSTLRNDANRFWDSVDLSRNIGEIKKTFHGTKDQIVIHIQDAHANYEAQRNIAKIVNYFVSRHNVHLVNVEGTSGEINTALLSSFPDAAVRRMVSDYFLRKAKLTGPEYLALTKPKNFTLYGIEEKNLYEANRGIFVEALEYADDDEKTLKDLRLVLDEVSRAIYSDELRSVARQKKHFDKDPNYLHEYAEFLSQKGEKLEIPLMNYKNILSLRRLIDLEQEIDFKAAEREIEVFFEDLKKLLPREELSRFITNSVQFRLQKMTRSQYYGYLQERVNEVSIDRHRFQNVLDYIEYGRLYDAIGIDLFKELESMEKAVKVKLFRNEDEKRTDELFTYLGILENLFRFALVKDEVMFFYGNRNGFNSSNFVNFIDMAVAKYHLQLVNKLPKKLARIDEDARKVEKFYELAVKRDQAIMQNALARMDYEGSSISVMITGGFHTAGIQRTLEEKGISYMVIAPKMTSAVDEEAQTRLYEDSILRKPTPIEQFVLDNYMPKKTAILHDPRYQLAARSLLQLLDVDLAKTEQGNFAFVASAAALLQGMGILRGEKNGALKQDWEKRLVRLLETRGKSRDEIDKALSNLKTVADFLIKQDARIKAVTVGEQGREKKIYLIECGEISGGNFVLVVSNGKFSTQDASNREVRINDIFETEQEALKIASFDFSAGKQNWQANLYRTTRAHLDAIFKTAGQREKIAAMAGKPVETAGRADAATLFGQMGFTDQDQELRGIFTSLSGLSSAKDFSPGVRIAASVIKFALGRPDIVNSWYQNARGVPGSLRDVSQAVMQAKRSRTVPATKAWRRQQEEVLAASLGGLIHSIYEVNANSLGAAVREPEREFTRQVGMLTRVLRGEGAWSTHGLDDLVDRVFEQAFAEAMAGKTAEPEALLTTKQKRQNEIKKIVDKFPDISLADLKGMLEKSPSGYKLSESTLRSDLKELGLTRISAPSRVRRQERQEEIREIMAKFPAVSLKTLKMLLEKSPAALSILKAQGYNGNFLKRAGYQVSESTLRSDLKEIGVDWVSVTKRGKQRFYYDSASAQALALRKGVGEMTEPDAAFQKALLDKARIVEERLEVETLSAQLKSGTPLAQVTDAAIDLIDRTVFQLAGFHLDEEGQKGGAKAMMEGKMLQLRTGGGKTLAIASAILPMVLEGRASQGMGKMKGVAVTVQDAKLDEDSNAAAAILGRFGVRVGVLTKEGDKDVGYLYEQDALGDFVRGKAVSPDEVLSTAEVIYGKLETFVHRYNQELMAYDPTQRTLFRRDLHLILDEVDQNLIYEFHIPFTVAGGRPLPDAEKRNQFRKIVNRVVEKEILTNPLLFRRNDGQSSVELIEPAKILKMIKAAVKNKPAQFQAMAETECEDFVTAALQAHLYYDQKVKYLVKGGKIVLLGDNSQEEKTGMVLGGGLHQAIEAKENVAHLTLETYTSLRTTLKTFLFDRNLIREFSGASGTIDDAFMREVYGKETVSPAAQATKRIDMPTNVYATAAEKQRAYLARISQVHESGGSLIVKVESTKEADELKKWLISKGKVGAEEVRVISATTLAKVGEVVKQAGKPGSITIVTNIANRGIDIKLSAELRELEKTGIPGGLYAISTYYDEFEAYEFQFAGRVARRGDPGIWEAFISLEDSVFEKYGQTFEETRGALKSLVARLVNKYGEDYLAALNQAANAADRAELDDMLAKFRQQVKDYFVSTSKRQSEFEAQVDARTREFLKRREEIFRFEPLINRLYEEEAALELAAKLKKAAGNKELLLPILKSLKLTQVQYEAALQSPGVRKGKRTDFNELALLLVRTTGGEGLKRMFVRAQDIARQIRTAKAKKVAKILKTVSATKEDLQQVLKRKDVNGDMDVAAYILLRRHITNLLLITVDREMGAFASNFEKRQREIARTINANQMASQMANVNQLVEDPVGLTLIFGERMESANRKQTAVILHELGAPAKVPRALMSRAAMAARKLARVNWMRVAAMSLILALTYFLFKAGLLNLILTHSTVLTAALASVSPFVLGLTVIAFLILQNFLKPYINRIAGSEKYKIEVEAMFRGAKITGANLKSLSMYALNWLLLKVGMMAPVMAGGLVLAALAYPMTTISIFGTALPALPTALVISAVALFSSALYVLLNLRSLKEAPVSYRDIHRVLSTSTKTLLSLLAISFAFQSAATLPGLLLGLAAIASLFGICNLVVKLVTPGAHETEIGKTVKKGFSGYASAYIGLLFASFGVGRLLAYFNKGFGKVARKIQPAEQGMLSRLLNFTKRVESFIYKNDRTVDVINPAMVKRGMVLGFAGFLIFGGLAVLLGGPTVSLTAIKLLGLVPLALASLASLAAMTWIFKKIFKRPQIERAHTFKEFISTWIQHAVINAPMILFGVLALGTLVTQFIITQHFAVTALATLSQVLTGIGLALIIGIVFYYGIDYLNRHLSLKAREVFVVVFGLLAAIPTGAGAASSPAGFYEKQRTTTMLEALMGARQGEMQLGDITQKLQDIDRLEKEMPHQYSQGFNRMVANMRALSTEAESQPLRVATAPAEIPKEVVAPKPLMVAEAPQTTAPGEVPTLMSLTEPAPMPQGAVPTEPTAPAQTPARQTAPVPTEAPAPQTGEQFAAPKPTPQTAQPVVKAQQPAAKKVAEITQVPPASVTPRVQVNTASYDAFWGKYKAEHSFADGSAQYPEFYRPRYGEVRSHLGDDIAMPIGTPIYAPAGGEVFDIQTGDTSGLMIKIKHPNGMVTKYLHLSAVPQAIRDAIAAGKTYPVQAGELIALSGDSGSPGAEHLHFEMWVGKDHPIAPYDNFERFIRENEGKGAQAVPGKISLTETQEYLAIVPQLIVIGRLRFMADVRFATLSRDVRSWLYKDLFIENASEIYREQYQAVKTANPEGKELDIRKQAIDKTIEALILMPLVPQDILQNTAVTVAMSGPAGAGQKMVEHLHDQQAMRHVMRNILLELYRGAVETDSQHPDRKVMFDQPAEASQYKNLTVEGLLALALQRYTNIWEIDQQIAQAEGRVINTQYRPTVDLVARLGLGGAFGIGPEFGFWLKKPSEEPKAELAKRLPILQKYLQQAAVQSLLAEIYRIQTEWVRLNVEEQIFIGSEDKKITALKGELMKPEFVNDMQSEINKIDELRAKKAANYMNDLRIFMLMHGQITINTSDAEAVDRYKAFSGIIYHLRAAAENLDKQVKQESDQERAQTLESQIPRMARDMERARVRHTKADLMLRISGLTGVPADQISLDGNLSEWLWFNETPELPKSPEEALAAARKSSTLDRWQGAVILGNYGFVEGERTVAERIAAEKTKMAEIQTFVARAEQKRHVRLGLGFFMGLGLFFNLSSQKDKNIEPAAYLSQALKAHEHYEQVSQQTEFKRQQLVEEIQDSEKKLFGAPGQEGLYKISDARLENYQLVQTRLHEGKEATAEEVEKARQEYLAVMHAINEEHAVLERKYTQIDQLLMGIKEAEGAIKDKYQFTPQEEDFFKRLYVEHEQRQVPVVTLANQESSIQSAYRNSTELRQMQLDRNAAIRVLDKRLRDAGVKEFNDLFDERQSIENQISAVIRDKKLKPEEKEAKLQQLREKHSRVEIKLAAWREAILKVTFQAKAIRPKDARTPKNFWGLFGIDENTLRIRKGQTVTPEALGIKPPTVDPSRAQVTGVFVNSFSNEISVSPGLGVTLSAESGANFQADVSVLYLNVLRLEQNEKTHRNDLLNRLTAYERSYVVLVQAENQMKEQIAELERMRAVMAAALERKDGGEGKVKADMAHIDVRLMQSRSALNDILVNQKRALNQLKQLFNLPFQLDQLPVNAEFIQYIATLRALTVTAHTRLVNAIYANPSYYFEDIEKQVAENNRNLGLAIERAAREPHSKVRLNLVLGVGGFYGDVNLYDGAARVQQRVEIAQAEATRLRAEEAYLDTLASASLRLSKLKIEIGAQNSRIVYANTRLDKARADLLAAYILGNNGFRSAISNISKLLKKGDGVDNEQRILAFLVRNEIADENLPEVTLRGLIARAKEVIGSPYRNDTVYDDQLSIVYRRAEMAQIARNITGLEQGLEFLEGEKAKMDYIEKLLFVLENLEALANLDALENLDEKKRLEEVVDNDPEIRDIVNELNDPKTGPARKEQYEKLRNDLKQRMLKGASVEVSMESLRSMKPEDALAQINLQEQAKILGIIEKYGYLKGLSADFFVYHSLGLTTESTYAGPTHFSGGSITPNEGTSSMESSDTSASVPAGGTLDESQSPRTDKEATRHTYILNAGFRFYYLLPLTQGLEQSRQSAVVREFELAKSFSDFQSKQRLMAAGLHVLRAQSRVEEAAMMYEMWDQQYRQLYSGVSQTEYQRAMISFESGLARTKANMTEAANALEQVKIEFLRALRVVGGDVIAQLTPEDLETLRGMTGLTKNDLSELEKMADTLAEDDPRFKMHLERIKAQTKTLKLMRYEAFGPKIAFLGVVSLLEQSAELQFRLPLLNQQGKARADLQKAILKKLEAELPLLKDNLRVAAMRMINQLNASIDRLERTERIRDQARDEVVRAQDYFTKNGTFTGGPWTWEALSGAIVTYEKAQYALCDAQVELLRQHELFVEFLRTNGMTDEQIKNVLAIEPTVSEEAKVAERPLPKFETPAALIQPGAPEMYVPSEQPGQYDRAVLNLKFETGAETKDTVFRHVPPLQPGDPRIPLRDKIKQILQALDIRTDDAVLLNLDDWTVRIFEPYLRGHRLDDPNYTMANQKLDNMLKVLQTMQARSFKDGKTYLDWLKEEKKKYGDQAFAIKWDQEFYRISFSGGAGAA